MLNRAQYGKPPVTYRQADFVSQIGNYLQYFSWQFARDWGNIGSRAAMALFTLVGLTGAGALWQRDRRAFWASATLMFTLTFALIFYLNFKYGFSYDVDPSRGAVAREVRERDYFFVVGFAAFSLWVAVGFGALMQGIAESLRDRWTESRRWVVASPLLLFGLIPVFGNHLTASRAHETLARDFARDILETVEPYGVLITAGDNDTFPLWYAQEVEGIRRDVTLANLSLMNTRWHLQQIRRRQTPDFEPAKAAPIWKDWKGEKPTESALPLSEQDINDLPEAQLLPHNSGVKFGELQVAFGRDTLMLSDLVSVFLIKYNLGKRPVYFSWSDGGYPDQLLGATGYLVTEGLARRLNPSPVEAKGNIVLNRGLGFVDTLRTRRLLFETYNYQAASRVRPRGWVDRPSQSILSLYSVVYGTVSSSFLASGDSALAGRAESVATAVEANYTDR